MSSSLRYFFSVRQASSHDPLRGQSVKDLSCRSGNSLSSSIIGLVPSREQAGEAGLQGQLQDRFKDGLARSKNEQALRQRPDHLLHLAWPDPLIPPIAP